MTPAALLLLAPLARAQSELLPQGIHASLQPIQTLEYSHTILDEHDYLLSTTGLSLFSTVRRDEFAAEVDWDLMLREGNYFGTQDAQVAGRQAPRSVQQFGNVVSEGPTYRLDERPWRLYAGWNERFWQFRIGRQRTRWSDGIAFSAVDFIHRYQPMDIWTRPEAVDSVYTHVGPFPGAANLDFAAEYVPARLINDAMGLSRIGMEKEGTALYGYLGKDKEENGYRLEPASHPRWMGGGQVIIPIPDGRFTAEHALINSSLSRTIDNSLVSAAWGRTGHEWLSVEYFLNGRGTGTTDYDRTRVVQGNLYLLGRNYVTIHLGNPESVRLLWNAGDGSVMLELAERREIGAFSVSGGVQFFSGPPTSEFEEYGDRLFGLVAYNFDVLDRPTR
jgi:hypothetical protein